MRFRQFWQEHGLYYIQPGRGNEFSEGFDPRPILRALMPGSVVEVGCGIGRLCQAFDDYVGVDINPAAIEIARGRHPGKVFETYAPPLPRSDYQLYYCVLVHVPDDELEATFAANLPSTREVVIADIMGRKWRRPHRPPYTFNREIEDYQAYFPEADVLTFPLASYPGEVLTILKAVVPAP